MGIPDLNAHFQTRKIGVRSVRCFEIWHQQTKRSVRCNRTKGSVRYNVLLPMVFVMVVLSSWKERNAGVLIIEKAEVSTLYLSSAP